MKEKVKGTFFSEKEIAMLDIIYPTWRNLRDHVYETRILEIAAMHCFRDNLSGPAVESLRRCVNAIHNCDPYRSTPEYEALIQLT